MTKQRLSLRGIRVPQSKCICGFVLRGFWLKDSAYYKPNLGYVCNSCYEKKIRPTKVILAVKNEHLAMWGY